MLRLTFIALLLLLTGCPGSESGDSTQTGAAPAGQPGDAPAGQTADGAATTSEAPELSPDTVRVIADPTLKVPLNALAGSFAKQHKAGWHVDYFERGELTKQLAADPASMPYAIVLTDKIQMDELAAGGLVDTVTSRTFAGDRLVVVSSAAGPEWRPSSFFDLYKLRFTALGTGDASTIAGFYAEQAFATSGSHAKVADRLMAFPTLDALMDALTKDQVQMAVVTASPVAQRADLRTVLVIDEELYEDIRYQAAAVAGKSEAPGAMELLKFLAENAAVQKQLGGYGLEDRVQAMKETQ